MPATAPDVSTRILAVAAEEQSSEALVGVKQVKRTVKRVSAVWGAVAIIAAIFGAGFYARERLEHYATRERVAALGDDVQQLQKWKEAKDDHERSRDETMARMAGQIDRLYDHLMRENRH